MRFRVCENLRRIKRCLLLDRLTGSRKVVAVNLKQENVVSCRVSVTDRRPLDGEKVQTFSYLHFAESSHGPMPIGVRPKEN